MGQREAIMNQFFKTIFTTLLSSFFALGAFSFSYAGEIGERTYKQVCIQCHGMGIDGAPKSGDRKAWQKLIAEGQVRITSDGYLGVRKMPPRGGKPDLSLEQFSQAVVHMANQSGANWKDPSPSMLLAMEKEIQRATERRQKQANK